MGNARALPNRILHLPDRYLYVRGENAANMMSQGSIHSRAITLQVSSAVAMVLVAEVPVRASMLIISFPALSGSMMNSSLPPLNSTPIFTFRVCAGG